MKTIQKEIKEGVKHFLVEAMLGDYDEDDLDTLTRQALKYLDGKNVVLQKPNGSDLTGCCTARLERLIEDE